MPSTISAMAAKPTSFSCAEGHSPKASTPTSEVHTSCMPVEMGMALDTPICPNERYWFICPKAQQAPDTKA